MPDTEQILKVLKNERECIARQSRPLGEMPQCRKDEDGVKLCEYCDLCLPDDEILEVYDFLIKAYELLLNEGADSYIIRCKEPLGEETKLAFKDWGAKADTVTLDLKPLSDNFKAIIQGE